MQKIFIFLFLFLSANIVYAEIEYPTGVSEPLDIRLKKLQWNRYVTQNFVILSIDNSQGLWLKDNIEKIKTWCLSRWGFVDSDYTKECRIFCVPDKKLLEDLFHTKSPKIEIRKNLNILWLVLDDNPYRSINEYLTEICIKEYELSSNTNLGLWFKKGASQLARSTNEIKISLLLVLKKIKNKEILYFTDELFTLKETEYQTLNQKDKNLFDEQAMILCLFLRKEFGEAKLQGFLRISSNNDIQDVLKMVYNFNGFSQFDKQYIRFMNDLVNDVRIGKTPNSYLEIKQR